MGIDKTKSDRIKDKLTVSASTGVIGEPYEVYDDNQIRIITTGTGSNVIDIEGCLAGQDKSSDSNWTQIDQHSGATSASYDISTWDFIRLRQTTADTGGTLYIASFFSKAAAASGNSFTTIQADSGTSPVADSSADTLTVSGTSGEIETSGDSSTDTITIGLPNQITANQGSLANPTYSFTGATGYGMYYAGGLLKLVGNGTVFFDGDATACYFRRRLESRVSGSVTSPALSLDYTGNNDTGFYAPNYGGAGGNAVGISALRTASGIFTEDGLIQRIGTTAIADAEHFNNSMTWYINSGNLVFKWKDNAGTVRTLTVGTPA